MTRTSETNPAVRTAEGWEWNGRTYPTLADLELAQNQPTTRVPQALLELCRWSDDDDEVHLAELVGRIELALLQIGTDLDTTDQRLDVVRAMCDRAARHVHDASLIIEATFPQPATIAEPF